MTRWDADLVVRQWAAAAIASSDPARRAAVGLAQAVLLPDGEATVAQRQAWAKQALALAPAIAGSLQSLAWLLAGQEARQVLLGLGLDPRKGGGEHSLRFFHDPIGCGAPALAVAIGQGNLAAVEQALETMDPTQPLPGGRASVANRDGDNDWRPTTAPNWLGWSLLLGQWAIAERLWQHPGMKTQDSLDMALFETVRGVVGNHKSPAPEALFWIKRLVKVGANPHACISMTPERKARSQWFYGPIQGRPKETLESLGWQFFQDQPYCGWPTAGRLDAPPTGKEWTAAQLLWRQDSPLLLASPPPRERGGTVDPDDQARHEALREGVDLLMAGAGAQDWARMLQQLMRVTAAECFQSNASKSAVSWPNWIEAGWQYPSIQDLMGNDETRPDCLWLDLIALYHSARQQPHLYADLAQSCERALENVAGRISAEAIHVVPGLMRAMAACAGSNNDGLKEALLTPGLRDLMEQAPETMKHQLAQWCQEYATEAQRWGELRAGRLNGATSAQWQEEQASAQTLAMLRSALTGLLHKPSIRTARSRL